MARIFGEERLPPRNDPSHVRIPGSVGILSLSSPAPPDPQKPERGNLPGSSRAYPAQSQSSLGFRSRSCRYRKRLLNYPTSGLSKAPPWNPRLSFTREEGGRFLRRKATAPPEKQLGHKHELSGREKAPPSLAIPHK